MRLFVSDSVTVRITCAYFGEKSGSTEKFFNSCVAGGIKIYKIRRDEFGVVCKISSRDFKKIRSYARESGVRLCIIRKSGIGLYIKHRRKRHGFFAGGALALALMAYLTSCIWVIDIIGNENVSDDVIISCLESNGIKIGNFRYGYDMKKLQNKMLSDLNSLAWLWVDIDGTRVTVRVREKNFGVESEEQDGAYNMVASYSGYVKDILAKSGRCVVERGSIVSEGDLLISGISATSFRGNRYIHSQGAVLARTWRKKSGEYHHTKTEFLQSGNKIQKSTVNFFGFDVKLYLSENVDFDLFEKSTKKGQLKIFKNIYLPISFTTDEFCEIIREDTEIDDREVVLTAAKYLTAQIESERSEGAVTVKRECEYKKLDNGNMFVTVIVESEENIAQPVKIEVDETKE